MRVKSLVAGLGLSVAAALALGPAVANASRGVSPNVEEPAAPAEPVEETPAPIEETTTTTTAPEVVEEDPAPPVVEEETPDPVVEEPAPTTTTTTRPAPKVETPVVEPAPVVVNAEAKTKAAKEPCHMDRYEPRDVDGLDGGEAARANKVDRNGNGTVCRKDIPGNGRGNTGEGSNIKDDQVR
jgi:outer membrane biosynthesis protein TonB